MNCSAFQHCEEMPWNHVAWISSQPCSITLQLPEVNSEPLTWRYSFALREAHLLSCWEVHSHVRASNQRQWTWHKDSNKRKLRAWLCPKIKQLLPAHRTSSDSVSEIISWQTDDLWLLTSRAWVSSHTSCLPHWYRVSSYSTKNPKTLKGISIIFDIGPTQS